METVMKTDHPLTAKGVEQARAFNAAWKARARIGFGAATRDRSADRDRSILDNQCMHAQGESGLYNQCMHAQGESVPILEAHKLIQI
jgi:hypothetical protein